MVRAWQLVVAVLFLALSPGAAVPTEPSAQIVHQPAGTVIVPDRFLRRWDPVTVFFDRDTGPKAGGPEDHPEKLVTVSPPQPGAWTWLNARTLQFRPAEPWPALGRFAWRVGGNTIPLSRLLDPTVKTIPNNGAAGLDPVETLTLVFAEPVEARALAQMLDI
ncbi:MAG TPA: Ig-like domain-containing protein, partial [Stellaceae bacterium]|nr:Ig-like domain-containing protein [Stellaceae bacterium]